MVLPFLKKKDIIESELKATQDTFLSVVIFIFISTHDYTWQLLINGLQPK